MPVTKHEAQRLAGHHKPIFGWVSEGNVWSSAPADEDLYHIKITRVVDSRGVTNFIFTKAASPASNRASVQKYPRNPVRNTSKLARM